MGEVIKAPFKTQLDLPVDQVLEAAIGELDLVLVIGRDSSGEPYIASSMASGGDILWWLEIARKRLMENQ